MDFPCIALLTDFEERDGFVGVMKGVILTRLSQPVPIVDISHRIERQNIRQAMWALENAYPYFPPKTIFVSVVDPGVGHQEQASLLCYWPERRQAFLAPDNGLLTPIFEVAGSALQVYDIRQSDAYQQDSLSLHGRSRTFHGRDVYAPMAALLANAMLSGSTESFLQSLGAPLKEVRHLSRRAPSRQGLGANSLALTGEIVAVDTFGNLVTNIPQDWLPVGGLFSVTLAESQPVICPFLGTYSEAHIDDNGSSPLIVVPSSSGMVELAVFLGNAHALTQVVAGDTVAMEMVP